MNTPQIISAVGAFLFNQEGKVFLAKFTKKFDSKWSIPGGKIEFGEDQQTAIIREVKEETNLEMKNLHHLKSGAFTHLGNHIVYTDYVATVDEKNSTVVINEEFSTWGFFSAGDLDQIDVIESLRPSLNLAFKFWWRNHITSYLSNFNLGLIRKTIHFRHHQKNWSEAYAWILQQLQLDSKIYSVEHIGSTSVEDIVAKPIIDILITFNDQAQFQKDIHSKFETLGFIYKGDAIAQFHPEDGEDKDRHCFTYYDNCLKIDYIHLHAFPQGHPHATNLKLFRDRLRSDNELREKYQKLKIQIEKSGTHRKDIPAKKTELIKKSLFP